MWNSGRSLKVIAAIASTAFSVSVAYAFYTWKRQIVMLQKKVRDLEISLQSSLQNRAAERKGRIRAEQALRKTLTEKADHVDSCSYPMQPIGIVQSCFSLRNGTPRQPLLVSSARACVVLDLQKIPSAALDGLAEFSHCWVSCVFHKNTDLPKLWQPIGSSDFKAKVRVPRLPGVKMGVFATRSPHRPCPIGLSVAKIEGVQGHLLLLSGIDLVDGTPVLDIKPYLPYCDSIQGATVPDWIKGNGLDDPLAVTSVTFSPEFSASLERCWEIKGKYSLYPSWREFQTLIEQVLSRDIRSFSQRQNPHKSKFEYSNMISNEFDNTNSQSDYSDQTNVVQVCSEEGVDQTMSNSRLAGDIIEYHLILEGIDISYTIDAHSNVVGHSAVPSSNIGESIVHQCNHITWSAIVNNQDN